MNHLNIRTLATFLHMINDILCGVFCEKMKKSFPLGPNIFRAASVELSEKHFEFTALKVALDILRKIIVLLRPQRVLSDGNSGKARYFLSLCSILDQFRQNCMRMPYVWCPILYCFYL